MRDLPLGPVVTWTGWLDEVGPSTPPRCACARRPPRLIAAPADDNANRIRVLLSDMLKLVASQTRGWDAAPIASRLLVKPGAAALCSAQQPTAGGECRWHPVI